MKAGKIYPVAKDIAREDAEQSGDNAPLISDSGTGRIRVSTFMLSSSSRSAIQQPRPICFTDSSDIQEQENN